MKHLGLIVRFLLSVPEEMRPVLTLREVEVLDLGFDDFKPDGTPLYAPRYVRLLSLLGITVEPSRAYDDDDRRHGDLHMAPELAF